MWSTQKSFPLKGLARLLSKDFTQVVLLERSRLCVCVRFLGMQHFLGEREGRQEIPSKSALSLLRRRGGGWGGPLCCHSCISLGGKLHIPKQGLVAQRDCDVMRGLACGTSWHRPLWRLASWNPRRVFHITGGAFARSTSQFQGQCFSCFLPCVSLPPIYMCVCV